MDTPCTKIEGEKYKGGKSKKGVDFQSHTMIYRALRGAVAEQQLKKKIPAIGQIPAISYSIMTIPMVSLSTNTYCFENIWKIWFCSCQSWHLSKINILCWMEHDIFFWNIDILKFSEQKKNRIMNIWIIRKLHVFQSSIFF